MMGPTRQVPPQQPMAGMAWVSLAVGVGSSHAHSGHACTHGAWTLWTLWTLWHCVLWQACLCAGVARVLVQCWGHAMAAPILPTANPIGVTGATAIAHALFFNTTIENINFGSLGMPPPPKPHLPRIPSFMA